MTPKKSQRHAISVLSPEREAVKYSDPLRAEFRYGVFCGALLGGGSVMAFVAAVDVAIGWGWLR